MNCLFYVRTKYSKKIVPVYDVRQRGDDADFLVYLDERFVYSFSRLYEPLKEGSENENSI